MEEICKNRAEKTSEQVFKNIKPEMKAEEKLNLLVSGMIPFSGEKLSFLLMLIPVFSGPEGIAIRNCYTNMLEKLYLKPFADTLHRGTEENTYACREAEFSAKMLIVLINHFWLEICDRVFENERKDYISDPSELMNVTENYRTAAERLLSAPYGSIQIIQLPELKILTESIHMHWKE